MADGCGKMGVLSMILLVENAIANPAAPAFIDGSLLRRANAAFGAQHCKPLPKLTCLVKYSTQLGTARMMIEKKEEEYASPPQESTLPARPDGPDPFSMSKSEISMLREKIKRLVEGSLKNG